MVRPSLMKASDNEDDINLISTKRERSEAMKKDLVNATRRTKQLYNKIKEEKWDEALQQLDYHERDAKNWIEEVNTDGSKRWRSLPIHLVCERKPPFEVVNQLLRIYPESLAQKNYGGDLPIHIAMRDGANRDIIELMLEKDTESAIVQDCEGRLALHLAASNSATNLKIVQDLILLNERASRTPDDFGLLPLHWACTKNAPAMTVEAIIKAYPYAVEARDTYGKLPIDRIKSSRNPEKAHIIEMLSRDVSSWSNAMMSTIATLNNQVSEAEKMQVEFQEQVKQSRAVLEQNAYSQHVIESLEKELRSLERHYLEEIQTLKEEHSKELEFKAEQHREEISELTREKDEAEKRASDLKILVDELVEQLKAQKLLVDEKEASRKELKNKALALVKRLDEEKEASRAKSDENDRLQMEKIKLVHEIEKRDLHIRKVGDTFKQGMGSLAYENSERSVDFDRRDYRTRSRSRGHQDRRARGSREVYDY